MPDRPSRTSPVAGGNRSYRRLATAEDPLHQRGLRRALAALGPRHASHHLVDVLAAARPRRVAAFAAGHLSTHRVSSSGLIEQEAHHTPRGLSFPVVVTPSRQGFFRDGPETHLVSRRHTGK